MRSFEAQHSPFTRYGYDDNCLEEHDDPPDREYCPTGRPRLFRERKRHSHKYDTSSDEGEKTETHRKQQVLKFSANTEYPNNSVLYAEKEAAHGE